MCRPQFRAVLFAALVLLVAPMTAHSQPLVKPSPDPFGHPLPKHALMRLGTPGMRHSGAVGGVAYSPDGKRLASCDSQTVRFWNATTGRLERVVTDDLFHWLHGMGFSPDGRWLAVGDYQWLILMNAASGKIIHRLDRGKAGYASHFHFAAKGTTLASATGSTIRVWDTATGKLLRTLPDLGDHCIGIALSPDGNTLAAMTAIGELSRWNVPDGKQVTRQKLATKLTEAPPAVFSADGTLLASRMAKEGLRVQQVESGKMVFQLPAKDSEFEPIQFTTDQKHLIARGFGGKVIAWNIADGKQKGKAIAVPTRGTSLALSPDGKSLAFGMGYMVSVVDSASGTKHITVPLLSPLESAFFLKEGGTIATLAVSNWNWRDDYHTPRLLLWEAATGKRQATTEKEDVPEGGLAALRPQGDLAICDSPFGKENQKIPLWDVASAKVARTLLGDEDRMRLLVFSADGSQLAAACSQCNEKRETEKVTVRVWEVATGKELHTWKMPKQMIVGLAFAPDGKTLALARGFLFDKCARHELAFLDLATGKSRLLAYPEPIMGGNVVFSADGRFLAVAGMQLDKEGSRSIFLYEVASGRLIWKALQVWGSVGALTPPDYEKDPCARLVFSPDNRTLLSTHYHDVRCWHSTTGKVRSQLTGHLGQITSLALSPDGRTLLTASMDRTALVWDVAEFLKPQPIPARKLTVEELKQCWENLASHDPAPAYAAMELLRTNPTQATEWLQQHLRPALPLDKVAVAKHLAALGSKQFAVREQATTALEQFGEQLVPLLRQHWQGPLSLEVKRRVELLLARFDPLEPGSELLRGHRAVALLESLPVPAARQLLQTLADGARPARLTQEARLALKRFQNETH